MDEYGVAGFQGVPDDVAGGIGGEGDVAAPVSGGEGVDEEGLLGQHAAESLEDAAGGAGVEVDV